MTVFLKTVLCVGLLWGSSALAFPGSAPQCGWGELNGSWTSIEPMTSQPGVEIRGLLTFRLQNWNGDYESAFGDYSLTAMCSYYDGTSLQTTVSTRVEVNGNNVQTLDPVQSATQSGPKYCTASIPLQVFQYQVNQNVLIMYTMSGKYYFQRTTH